MDKQQTPGLARMLESATTHCNKCGFCLPFCPTYRETGQESASPRGRLDLMLAVARGEVGLTRLRAPLEGCLGCLACTSACPSGIPYGHWLEEARIDLRRNGQAPAVPLGGLLSHPRRLRLVLWLGWLFQRTGLRYVFGGAGLLRFVWPSLARLERAGPLLPVPLPWRGKARQWLAGGATAPTQGREVFLLTGCVMDAVFGPVHLATVKVLAKNGYRVRIPEGQGCCGALHLHGGDADSARAMARVNIAAMEDAQNAPVLINSAGCGAAMKDYGALLADDPQWAGRARAFSARVRDISEFLAGEGITPPTTPLELKVAYDDPCHLSHGQGVRTQPRTLLEQIPGLRLVSLPESDWCCGSAGSFSVQQPEMAARILARKMRHVSESGADVLASGNPGCLLHLSKGVRQARLPTRVHHPIELLAMAYDQDGAKPAG